MNNICPMIVIVVFFVSVTSLFVVMVTSFIVAIFYTLSSRDESSLILFEQSSGLPKEEETKIKIEKCK